MTNTIDNPLPPHIAELVEAGALFVISHSGGKDSQAMYGWLTRQLPADQVVVVHADLTEVEWPGVQDHIRSQIDGRELHVVKAGKSFFDMVEQRAAKFEAEGRDVPCWPSAAQRQCTSDLKRDPIAKFIRNCGAELVVNCMGLRAEESASRAKRAAFRTATRLCTRSRTVVEWLPIQGWTLDEVWQAIEDSGQVRHWAYDKGMTRLSCAFCILASKADLTIAAQENPALYAKYVELEKRTGYTMRADAGLEQVTGIKAEVEAVERPAAVLSFGGGVDSTAILAAHLQRDRAAELLGLDRATLDRALPPLDAVVFADTGAESQATYRNVAQARALCEAAGLEFVTVRKTDREGEVYRIQDHHLRLGTLPIMPGCGHVCSLKFKQEPIRAWRADRFDGRDVVGLIGYESQETGRAAKVEAKQGARDVEYQLGFEAGEGRRCAKAGRFNPEPGVKYRFPLVELGLDRAGCQALLAELWPIEVAKSSCVFCPFMTEAEIRELYCTDRAGWQLVVDLEAALRRESDRKHGAYLEAMAAHQADPEANPSPLNRAGKCRAGYWSRHTWREGVRAFWGTKRGGQALSTAEWAEIFEAELAADAAAAAAQTAERQVVLGTPINPVELLDTLAGYSFCVSYASRQKLGGQIDRIIELVNADARAFLLIDNGAFTHWRRGGAMTADYVAGFEAWAQGIIDRCPKAVAVLPDVIDGTVEDNWRLVLASRLDRRRAMPIWHLHEPLEYLAHMIDAGFDFVGFGSSGEYASGQGAAWSARVEAALALVDDMTAPGNPAGRVRPHVHMMRCQAALDRFAFNSADSTNVAVNHNRYQATHNGHRARFLADRIRDRAIAAGPVPIGRDIWVELAAGA